MFRMIQLNLAIFLIASCGFSLEIPSLLANPFYQLDNGTRISRLPSGIQDNHRQAQERNYNLFDVDPFIDRRPEANRSGTKSKDLNLSSSILSEAVSPSGLSDRDVLSPDRTETTLETIPVQISSGRQLQLIEFIQENLPDLEEPLLLLKSSSPPLFQSALGAIDQSLTKLESISKTGNQDAYERALSNWRIDSQIKIAIVELSFANTPRLVRNLERLIERQHEIRIENLKADREYLMSRLDQVDKVIEKLELNQSEEIQRKMNTALRSAAKSRKNEAQVNQKQDDLRSKTQATPNRSSRTEDDFLNPVIQYEFGLPKR